VRTQTGEEGEKKEKPLLNLKTAKGKKKAACCLRGGEKKRGATVIPVFQKGKGRVRGARVLGKKKAVSQRGERTASVHSYLEGGKRVLRKKGGSHPQFLFRKRRGGKKKSLHLIFYEEEKSFRDVGGGKK